LGSLTGNQRQSPKFQADFTALAVHVLSLPSLKTRETPRFSEEDVEEMVERVKQNFPAAHVGIDPAKPGSFRTVLVVGGRSIGRRLLAAHAIAQYLAANPETLVLNAPVPMVGEPVQDDFREKARQFLEKYPEVAGFKTEEEVAECFRSIATMRTFEAPVPDFEPGFLNSLREKMQRGMIEFVENVEASEEHEEERRRLQSLRDMLHPPASGLMYGAVPRGNAFFPEAKRRRNLQGRYRETYEPHRCPVTIEGERCRFSVGHAGECSFKDAGLPEKRDAPEEPSPEDDIEERRRVPFKTIISPPEMTRFTDGRTGIPPQSRCIPTPFLCPNQTINHFPCILPKGHEGDCEAVKRPELCGEPEPYGETDCTMPSGHQGPHLSGEGEEARPWPQNFKTSFPAYLYPKDDEE
jgi:hypothetical protein